MCIVLSRNIKVKKTEFKTSVECFGKVTHTKSYDVVIKRDCQLDEL